MNGLTEMQIYDRNKKTFGSIQKTLINFYVNVCKHFIHEWLKKNISYQPYQLYTVINLNV